MRPDQAAKATMFRALHQRQGAFVIPNPCARASPNRDRMGHMAEIPRSRKGRLGVTADKPAFWQAIAPKY